MPKSWLMFLLLSVTPWSQTRHDDRSMFSHGAVSIWSSGDVTIPSPDGRKEIVVKPPEWPDAEETHTVLVRAAGHAYRTRIGALVNAEAAWSPDSTAFFVTYSDGGMVGTYHVMVVYVTNSGLRVVEPVPNGRRLFKPTCFDPEVPNVGAIGWVGQDSDRLAIAVQVPPHSSCASMGTFKAFVSGYRPEAWCLNTDKSKRRKRSRVRWEACLRTLMMTVSKSLRTAFRAE